MMVANSLIDAGHIYHATKGGQKFERLEGDRDVLFSLPRLLPSTSLAEEPKIT